MLRDKVLILIYRSLRDAISNNIVDVAFDQKKKTIDLTFKNTDISYPHEKKEEKSNSDLESEIHCKINSDGIIINSSEELIADNKKSFLKRLFRY